MWPSHWTCLVGFPVLVVAQWSFLLGCVRAFSQPPLTLPPRTFLGTCFMDPSLHVEDDIDAPKKQFDKNGKEFEVGQKIRVRREGIKAHQVPSNATGIFDGTVFKADDSLPYLIVPAGLCGVVTKVIDTQVLSANFPIRVRFEPDEISGEGFRAPASFVMHFGPQEVEIV